MIMETQQRTPPQGGTGVKYPTGNPMPVAKRLHGMLRLALDNEDEGINTEAFLRLFADYVADVDERLARQAVRIATLEAELMNLKHPRGTP